MLVIGDTTYGWGSAQAGWLEGRLCDLLDGATLATPSIGNCPQGKTVRQHGRAALEAATEPIRVMASASPAAVVGGDGVLTVDGQRFATPSAAGSYVRGGKATNGWAFWAVERDRTTVPLATVRARYLRRSQAQES